MIKRVLTFLILFMSILYFGNCQSKPKKEEAKSSTSAAPAGQKDKSPAKVTKKKASRLGKALIRLPRSYNKGDIIEVKTVITHPQVTGLGKKAKPAHYVNSIEVFYGGNSITSFETYPSISKDPYFSFKLRAAKSAPLKVVWKDNKGNTFEKSVDVKVGG